MRVQAEAKGVAVVAERHRRRGAGAGQPGEGPARAVQPDPERDPPHAGRRHVVVRAESADDGVEVEVADTGDGIAPSRARARLRAVLPRRRRAARDAQRRRARPGDLARDRRGPRRPHLARRVDRRNPRALLAADGRRGRRVSDPITVAVAPTAPVAGVRPLVAHRRGGGATATVAGVRPLVAWGLTPRGYAGRVAQRTDIFDLAALGLTPGEGRRLELVVGLDPLDFGGETYAPEALVPARVEVSKMTGGGYALRLAFAVALSGPCQRCLEAATPHVEVDAREVDQPGGGDELSLALCAGRRSRRPRLGARRARARPPESDPVPRGLRRPVPDLRGQPQRCGPRPQARIDT